MFFVEENLIYNANALWRKNYNLSGKLLSEKWIVLMTTQQIRNFFRFCSYDYLGVLKDLIA